VSDAHRPAGAYHLAVGDETPEYGNSFGTAGKEEEENANRLTETKFIALKIRLGLFLLDLFYKRFLIKMAIILKPAGISSQILTSVSRLALTPPQVCVIFHILTFLPLFVRLLLLRERLCPS